MIKFKFFDTCRKAAIDLYADKPSFWSPTDEPLPEISMILRDKCLWTIFIWMKNYDQGDKSYIRTEGGFFFFGENPKTYHL